MRIGCIYLGELLLSVCLVGGFPATAQPADSGLPARPAVRLDLEPLLTSGLSSPVYVTSARDGSGRLFIVEQPGRIKIWCSCLPAVRVFLDIASKVSAGGERGLLGLAFHPRFSENRRFFVNYTRAGDGATVVSEFRASESDPNASDPDETMLLTVEQPFANHNGGMIDFGPDGFLYIGTGDGGSANDPGNRAQNPQVLLGKVLRIDVDRQEGGNRYAIPRDNPYYGAPSAGRPEIFALGLRNPWRFSFDRATGRLYAADVGQGQLEEVSVISRGGNYGWRVMEGTRCTGLGPAPCGSPGFVPPLAEYPHSGGRCSITGGYVYRGSRGSLPLGSYVYGDYCTGEIFLLIAGTQVLLADTPFQIVSFGEDEEGEVYVVGLGGTIHRIANPDASSPTTAYFPYLRTVGGAAAGRDEYTGFAVTNLDTKPATLSFEAFDTDGVPIQGPDIENPRRLELGPRQQLALLDAQIFGRGFVDSGRSGWVRLEGSHGRLAGFFLSFDSGLSTIDGAPADANLLTRFVLPDVGAAAGTVIRVANPGPQGATLSADLVSAHGSVKSRYSGLIPGRGVLSASLADLFPAAAPVGGDYVEGLSEQGVVPLSVISAPGRDSRVLQGLDATGGAVLLFAPQYAVGGGYLSVLSIVNVGTDAGVVTFRLFRDDGSQAGSTRELPISSRGKLQISDPSFFADFGVGLVQGYVEIRSSGPGLAGSIAYGDARGAGFSTSLPLVSVLRKALVFAQVASDDTYFTGVALLNPGSVTARTALEVFDGAGHLLGSTVVDIAPGRRVSRVLTEYLPELAGEGIGSGSIRVSGDTGIAGFVVFGTSNLRALSAVPAQPDSHP